MMYGVLPLLLASVAGANLISRQILGTSTVTLSNNTGTISHLASGILYGIPDTKNQIADSFYTDIGFNYARAGGAQVPAPVRAPAFGAAPRRKDLITKSGQYRTG